MAPVSDGSLMFETMSVHNIFYSSYVCFALDIRINYNINIKKVLSHVNTSIFSRKKKKEEKLEKTRKLT